VGTEIVRRRLFLCGAFVACIIFCGCGDCGNEVVSETKSPDQKLKAVVFEQNCGPTTGFSMQISILSSSASPPLGRGNVFIAGDENQAMPANRKPPIEIKVTWESNIFLLVSYPKNAQVFLKKPHVAGVAVKYVAIP
jgi:hypothetical protein